MSDLEFDTQTQRPFTNLWPPYNGTLFEGNPDLCDKAQAYLTICHTLFEDAQVKVTLALEEESISLDKQRVVLKDLAYIELRMERAFWQTLRSAPKRCQRQGLASKGHCCMLAVFERYQARLEQMQAPFAGSVLDIPEPKVVVKTEYVKTLVPAIELFPEGADVD